MKKLMLILVILTMTLLVNGQLIINEFQYDTPGSDTLTYIELWGRPGESLDGFSIYGIDGNDGSTYNSIDLTGNIIPSDGYFVIGQTANVPEYDMIDPNVNYQNGPDNIVLMNMATGDTLDAVGYGLFDTEVFAGEIMPTYDVYSVSLGRFRFWDSSSSVYLPNNSDINYYDFTGFYNPTPGAANPDPIPLTINDIQNAAGASPYEDSTIYTEGVITAVFPGEGLYFIQNSSGMYNGVCIYEDKRVGLVRRGEKVTIVAGYIYEAYDRTCIEYPVSAYLDSVADTFSIYTTEISLPVDEGSEGQLITVKNVTMTDTLGYGEWQITDASANTGVVDDYGTYIQPNTGDKFASITGVVDYSYGTYKIEPRDENDLVYGYDIDGTVGLSDGPADSSGTTVEITELSYTDTTDASGIYGFEFIPDGIYTFVFSHAGYIPDTIIDTVTGGNATINTVLDPAIATYNITGTVGLSDNPADSSGSVVEISELALFDTTDAQGYYEFLGVDEGIYTLYYTHDGYTPDTVIDTLNSDDVINITLTALSGIDSNIKADIPVISGINTANGLSFIYNKTDNAPSVVALFDMTGRKVFSRTVSKSGTMKITAGDLDVSGIYFIRIIEAENTHTRKVLLVR
ncbi:MAG: T9SS type A sorting domain-containing protein [candidate division WOR-3 bacterium]|nr:T9SS type A sorting domain-containing protein [candidate division WOR-3 bacterium]